MKKLFALFLTLMMLCSCGLAEDMNHYQLSPEAFAEVEGNYLLLEKFGVMLFVPADFVSFEVSEEEATTKGTLAIMGREDASLMMTIAYAGMADAEGNLITTYEDLAAFYQLSGADVEVCIVNNIQAMTYTLPTEGMLTNGLCILTSEGAVLNFCTVSFTEDDCLLGSLMMLSTMPQVTE